MNEVLIDVLGVEVTGWKIFGYTGVFMFTFRWFVQLWASRAAGKPTVPRLFWVLSMLGSLMCLTYFVFGKNDSVGVLGYLFPSAVAAYNLFLETKHRRRQKADPSRTSDE